MVYRKGIYKIKESTWPYIVQVIPTIAFSIAVSGGINKIANSDLGKYSIEAAGWAALVTSMVLAGYKYYENLKKNKGRNLGFN